MSRQALRLLIAIAIPMVLVAVAVAAYRIWLLQPRATLVGP